MTHHNIELHIEELVLHGFAPADRYAIGEAVQRELTRLFTEQGVRPTLANARQIERLDTGAFHVKRGSRADAIGTQVAQSLYGGLKQ